MTEFDYAAMTAQGQNAGVPTLYVMVMTPLPQTSGAAPAGTAGGPSPLEAHYEYMHRLIEQGKVLLIGPCLHEPAVPDGPPVPPGVGILKVASREEAEDIARNEPFHRLGWRRNTVLAWTVKFGSLIPDLLAHLNTHSPESA